MNKIFLKVIQGKMKPMEFSFQERTTCVIGRALDCNILLPDDQAHSTISRYHCLLDINPPEICIRDFGSLNGTFVNDTKIGQRVNGDDIAKAQEFLFPEYDLKDGDKIQLGDTVFQVIKEIIAQKVSKAANGSPSCDSMAERTFNSQPATNAQLQSPKLDPLDKIKLILNQAEKGNQELISVKGYTIEKELGKGNMGAVYLAVKNDTQKKVALKIMLPRVESEPKAQQQFIRETKNTKLLNHKNVVGVYDIGCYGNTFFFTTDYCEAGSVAELIQQYGGKIPLKFALELFLQALEGLHSAHTVRIPVIMLANGKKSSGIGLVHRDIKPGNILLTKVDGKLQAKIADFGLAKAFDTAGLSGRTATGVSAGTPYYMPRQQVINFKFCKPEVDVWALAATFYKMVTGKYPRKYKKGVDPWLTTLKSTVTPIREYEPSLSHGLAKVIDNALIDQPEITYKSAAELKEALLKVI